MRTPQSRLTRILVVASLAMLPTLAQPAGAATHAKRGSHSVAPTAKQGSQTDAPQARRGSRSTAPTGLLNQSFTARNGLSSKYHVYSAGVSQPAGLVLQFHGDGAYEFRNPGSSYSLGGSNGIVEQARQRGYITVPVLSPDKKGSITWWESGSANADYVNDLVATLKTKYRIDSNKIWLVGYSGGAQFITQFYLPKYSGTIQGGGAVIFGGGGTPRVTASPFASSLKARFPMYWYTGANDNGSSSSDGYNALRDAKAGQAWYLKNGFATSHTYPANTAHNLSGRFGGVVGAQLDRGR